MQTGQVIIRINNYSYSYPEQKINALSNVTMEIRAGECHCIAGQTGSGKTTLLLAIKNLLPEGKKQGEIIRTSSEAAPEQVAIILQNPETQILRSTVGEEVAFGLENICIPSEEMKPVVKRSLSLVDLRKSLSFDTGALSMGQKYRMIMASFLVMKPGLFLIDEPCAQLDPEGTETLIEIITHLKRKGVAFVICEHHPELISEVIDRTCSLAPNCKINQDTDLPLRHLYDDKPHKKAMTPVNDSAIVTVEKLCAGGNSNQPVLSNISFTLKKGDRMVICGLNGAGKTTLLKCLTGFIRPFSGSVKINEQPPRLSLLRRNAGCLFQNPERQLFETTVTREVAFPLKRLGVGKEDTSSQVRAVLNQWGIENLADDSPHKLSYGQKHMVALVSILVHHPDLIILDDPFAGLDKKKRRTVMNLLRYINEHHGSTIIWTTHNPMALDGWADVTLTMKRGTIVDHKY